MEFHALKRYEWHTVSPPNPPENSVHYEKERYERRLKIGGHALSQ
jgi:hypothetical protein